MVTPAVHLCTLVTKESTLEIIRALTKILVDRDRDRDTHTTRDVPKTRNAVAHCHPRAAMTSSTTITRVIRSHPNNISTTKSTTTTIRPLNRTPIVCKGKGWALRHNLILQVRDTSQPRLLPLSRRALQARLLHTPVSVPELIAMDRSRPPHRLPDMAHYRAAVAVSNRRFSRLRLLALAPRRPRVLARWYLAT